MITIVGSINLDLIARVERLPAPGETVLGDQFTTAPGGKGANQALAACRAGGAVRIIGAVGRDSFAQDALALLRDAGVDLSRVKKASAPTGIASILVGADAENVIAVVPGANSEVLAQDIAGAGFANGELVLLQQEIPLVTIEAALNAARMAQAISVLNAAPFHASAAALLNSADYIVTNETEFDLYADALQLEGATREDRMRFFAQTTGRIMIVTLGGEGLLAATPDRFLRIASLAVSPVDTVGAGDTFCGYLAASLAEGMRLEEALRRAAVAGALACLKQGAQPSIPSHMEVEEAIRHL